MLKMLAKLLLGLLLFIAIIMVAWYRIDGIPTAETDAFMTGDGYTATEESDGGLLFSPAISNGHGIVIMHGALILPKSYAKSAAFFAGRGYTVYLPNGPGRMSIAAVKQTAARIAALEIDQWFFIGHSMGGMASLETVSTQTINTKAVALWATAMPSDYSSLDVPILFIWGDTDGLLPVERFKLGQDNLPAAVHYITLEGANHKNFAMYGHQFFDSEATINWMEQIDFANETTAEFFAGFIDD
jgi:pimeloyl-ACP methyl ester carboxylesterase